MTCLPTAVQGILWEFAGPWTLRNLMHEAFTSERDWFEEIDPFVIQSYQQQFGPDADEDMETCITLKVKCIPHAWGPQNDWRMFWNVCCPGCRCDYTMTFHSLEEMMDFEPYFREFLPARVLLPTPVLARPEEEWEHLLDLEDMAVHEDWVTLSSRASFLQGLKEMKEGAQG